MNEMFRVIRIATDNDGHQPDRSHARTGCFSPFGGPFAAPDHHRHQLRGHDHGDTSLVTSIHCRIDHTECGSIEHAAFGSALGLRCTHRRGFANAEAAPRTASALLRLRSLRNVMDALHHRA